LCKQFDLPVPIAEYRFSEARRWRFDWAWPERKIAVEEDGGVWVQGRHTRGAGYLKDMEKLNAAAELGYRVFRFQTGKVDMAQLARVLA
jgi:very-short-patch-repair endonuclease